MLIMVPGFESFSFQHFFTLAILASLTIIAIVIGKRVDHKMKIWIGYTIASASFVVMLLDLLLRIYTHTLDILIDLPLFLCDIVALILPVIILRENRKWLGILYFWAVAGTMQALLTPDLNGGFPTFEFFRYFIMHGGIVSAVIYCVIVMKINITWRDLWNAVLYTQVYIVGVHIINLVLRSNYSYTMAKPQGATVLDFLGVWPWYILFSEVVMIILFVLLLLPFLLKPRVEIAEHVTSSGSEN